MFFIGTICLSETIQFVKTTDVEIMDIDVKIIISEQGFGIQNIEKNNLGNRYEPKVALEDKVNPNTYYKH